MIYLSAVTCNLEDAGSYRDHAALLLGGVAVAWDNWSRDPAQRTARGPGRSLAARACRLAS